MKLDKFVKNSDLKPLDIDQKHTTTWEVLIQENLPNLGKKSRNLWVFYFEAIPIHSPTSYMV